MRYKVRLVLWGCVFLLAYQVTIHNINWEVNFKKVPAVSPGTARVFYEEIGVPGDINDIDATEDFIYLSYGTLGVVAVYNWQGEHQYSIAVFATGKGGLKIRCMDNLLYVHDYAKYEMVFEGSKLLNVLSPNEKNHVMGWFAESTSPVYIKNGKIFSNNGEYIMEVPR